MEQKETAILLDGIGKEFETHSPKSYSSKRNRLRQIFRPSIYKSKDENVDLDHEIKEEFWALKDISFSLNKGEVLGIIGENGAGKSVLLKILAKVIRPTTGRACVKGKLIAMLEVDGSFHPDLTGRENVYISCSIFGMKIAQIKKVIDEIVEQSEISDFIDLPVKRYSNGMRVKLAFAIAMKMAPDILILDEILAVSDQSFRQKSIALLEKYKQEDKTLLLVSHDIKVLEDICTMALWLKDGKVQKFGNFKETLKDYLNHKNKELKFIDNR